MKVRFKPKNLKVLVTRISGKFNIYSVTNEKWDDKLTKGSFKITNEKYLYDEILEKITHIKTIYKHKYEYMDDDGWDKEEFFQKSMNRCIQGDLIFTVYEGVIEEVEVSNPKETIKHYKNDLGNDIIEFLSYSFTLKESNCRDYLSKLPKKVLEKMKSVRWEE